MKHRYLVLGGDLRNVKLAEMLADDGNRVFHLVKIDQTKF